MIGRIHCSIITYALCVFVLGFHWYRRVNVFVVVSDERENMRFNGFYFPQLFYKYYKEVHPAQLVLISFLEANAKVIFF